MPQGSCPGHLPDQPPKRTQAISQQPPDDGARQSEDASAMAAAGS